MKRKMKLTQFGKQVRKRLIDQDMRQIELAAYLGISNQYLYRILNGDRPDGRYREDIIRILKMEKSA